MNTMAFSLKSFLLVFLLKCAQGADPASWLPCQFTDEDITLTTEGQTLKVNMTPIYRQAVLQFGQKEDPPVNPDTLTFLITPSKLNIRGSLAGVEVAEVTCSLARYSTDGSHVRWPVRGEHEYSRWFTLHLSNSKQQFNIMAFLRQSTEQPPTGQHDYKSWSLIRDNEVLITSVVMVLKTPAPEVMSPLKSTSKLPCLFDIDHKGANLTVKWHKLGKNTSLFKHSSLSGRSEGSGVSLKQLAAGDASYTVPDTQISSVGTYVCSVNVHPLQGSLTVKLRIQEPPYVSLNVDPVLTLSEDEVKRVVCRAVGYYPLEVDMQWMRQDATDVGPKMVSAVFSSHSQNKNGTYKKSGFLSILPKLSNSGRKYTCSVSHRALSAPITKTFTLIVTEPGQWILVFNVFLLLVVLVLMLKYCRKGKKYQVFYTPCTKIMVWIWENLLSFQQ